MKQNITTFKTSLLLAGSLALAASCQDYEPFSEQQVKEVAYTQNFERMFGKIDPNHTWSTVTRSTLSAELNMPGSNSYTLKIYTANPRGEVQNCYLLGEWTVSSQSNSVHNFDMPANLSTVWVAVVNADGGRYVQPVVIKNNKCSVQFNLNASSSSSITRSATSGTYSESADYTGFPINRYYNNDETGFIQVYPEDNVDYSSGICTDFEIVATGGDITLTHFYSCTSGNDVLCYFTYDPSTETLATAYGDYHNHVTLCQGAASHTQVYVGNNGLSSYGSNAWNSVSDGFIDEGIINGKIINAPEGKDNAGCAVRGKTVTISGLTAGEHIVFYLYQAGGASLSHIAKQDKIAATRSSINQTWYRTSTEESLDAQLAGILTVGNTTFLGFEDALSFGGKPDKPNEFYDINDVVFTVTGNYIIEDHEDKIDKAMSYMIAYEDLGASYDFDFNDIVMKITHVSGRTTATATVLAAGGTLPVKLMYNQSPFCSNIHEAFGGKVINALPGKHSQYEPKVFAGLDIDENHDGNDDEFALSKFGIGVTQEDGYTDEIYSPQYYGVSLTSEGTLVEGSQKSNRLVPYAILIADPSWDWPDEHQSIAFKEEGFNDWVQDASQVEWYEGANKWGKAPIGGDTGDSEDGESVDLVVTYPHTFLYKDKNQNIEEYNKAAFIKFPENIASGSTATLTLTFSSAPGRTLYLNYALDRTQFYEIQNAGNETTVVFTAELSTETLDKAVRGGGLYLMAQKVNGEEADLGNFTATLTVKAPGEGGEGGETHTYLSETALNSYAFTVTAGESADTYTISYNGTAVKSNATEFTLNWSDLSSSSVYIYSNNWAYNGGTIYDETSGSKTVSASDLAKCFSDGGSLNITGNDGGTFKLYVN